MSAWLKLTLEGVDGRDWVLTEQCLEGAELRPGPQQLIDAPASTYWIRSIFGQSYQGMQWQRRDPVFSVTIAGRTPERWAKIDSDFRMSLGPVGDGVFSLRAQTNISDRRLCMRMLQQPDAYTKGDWEGKDPWIFATSTLAISAACEVPFWTGQSLVWSATFPSGSGTVDIPVANYGDVPIWLQWSLPAPGTWTVPDYSWGQELSFGRAPGQDATRTITLAPLTSGQNLVINTNPDQKQMITSDDTPYEQLNYGQQFMYPIPPQTLPTTIPLELVGGNSNTVAYVTCPAWFSRPWGVSL